MVSLSVSVSLRVCPCSCIAIICLVPHLATDREMYVTLQLPRLTIDPLLVAFCV